MTLEEAKKEIKRIYEDELKEYKEFHTVDSYYASSGMSEIIKIIDKVDTEPVGISDTLTLTELAYELGKLFHFKYLTLDSENCLIWDKEPFYAHSKEWVSFEGVFFEVPIILIKNNLDLSEYKDETGRIDYSKCIVEVK